MLWKTEKVSYQACPKWIQIELFRPKKNYNGTFEEVFRKDNRSVFIGSEGLHFKASFSISNKNMWAAMSQRASEGGLSSGGAGGEGGDMPVGGPRTQQQTAAQRRLQQTQAQVDEVVDIMKTNVEKVLERDQKLSELDDRAGKCTPTRCFTVRTTSRQVEEQILATEFKAANTGRAAERMRVSRLMPPLHVNRCVRGRRQIRSQMISTSCPHVCRNSMDNQLAELCVEPSSEFSNFVRMSCSDFEYLLQRYLQWLLKRYRLEGCNTSEGAPGSNIKIFSYWR
ncbi:Synaptobrevin [Eumeta japonica]|uniref:Synaptobrevin n=1 Tax=Eumeta variegata TaxID=151549 RepID=A0A4C1TQ83_EUMVA|nr:Synaptobrevin [Eumeta japonica]